MSTALAGAVAIRVVPAWGQFFRIVDAVPVAEWNGRMAHVFGLLLLLSTEAALWSVVSALSLRRVIYFGSGVR